MINKISIIIPNWNGKAFLKRCVAAALQSAVAYGRPFECLIMDDASTDGSGQEVAAEFPVVRLISHKANKGFGHMVNEGARLAQGEIILLVNNDLVAREDFVQRLCSHFDDAGDLFGVSGKTVNWEDGSPNHVNMRGFFENGSLRLTWSDDHETTETMFVQGGSAALRRDLFLEFGGFHPLFAPGYWEDYDMSYLGLKAGYRNLYEPAAVGSHLGQGSMIRAHGREKIDFVRTRNLYLMLALNLTDDDLHRQFWDRLSRFVRNDDRLRFKLRFELFQYLVANREIIMAERQRRTELVKLSDSEVFARFAGLGTPC